MKNKTLISKKIIAEMIEGIEVEVTEFEDTINNQKYVEYIDNHDSGHLIEVYLKNEESGIEFLSWVEIGLNTESDVFVFKPIKDDQENYELSKIKGNVVIFNNYKIEYLKDENKIVVNKLPKELQLPTLEEYYNSQEYKDLENQNISTK
jgi:hypothetical protein